ncbi:MAG TPA: hypothetical protein VF476_13605 [Chitinophagaceae bacterium]
MKKSKQQNPKQNIKFNANKHRAENKDNLDSREGEEQQFKGDDMTHNKKERQSERKRFGKRHP